jgi:hypothetical protein
MVCNFKGISIVIYVMFRWCVLFCKLQLCVQVSVAFRSEDTFQSVQTILLSNLQLTKYGKLGVTGKGLNNFLFYIFYSFYFVEWPNNSQLIDKLLYCSYMLILSLYWPCMYILGQYHDSINIQTIIHSFSSLSHDRSKAFSKASSPHSAI